MNIEAAIDQVAGGQRPSLASATALLSARGDDLERLRCAADQQRQAQVGDTVTYVVNRNINFTNVCIKRCHFCAFSDGLRAQSGYFLPLHEVVRRAQEAAAMGATEICIQAGLAPELDASRYLAITEAVKTATPDLHLHAWSPEEIKHGAKNSRCSIPEFLADLKSAGLDSIPGTSAEILDDRLRQQLAVGRLTTEQWLHIIRAAHALGIPTTSTMMFGHLERAEDQAHHLLTLLQLQRETGGLTEFVPLAFVHQEAPLFAASKAVRAGPSRQERRAVYAASRLLLGETIKNIQVSWVKEGMAEASDLLRYGANDLGGTLINESISTSAGAPHGQRQSPKALADLIVACGRQPQQRNTLYEPIDSRPLANWDGDYGSWQELRQDERFAYTPSGKPSRSAAVSMSQASPRR